MAASVLGFLTQILLARHLGAASYGALAAALATVGLVGPIAAFGVAPYWLRVFGLEGWDGLRWLRASFQLTLVSVAGALGGIGIWAFFGGAGPLTRSLLIWLSPLVVLYALTQLVFSRLQLEERYAALTAWQISPYLGKLLVAGCAAGLGLSLTFIAGGLAAVGLILSVAAAVVLLRMSRDQFALVGHGLRRQPETRAPSVGHLVGEAWPFAAAGFFYLVYFQSDILLLDWLVAPDAAGTYNVAFVILAGVYSIPGAIYQKFLLPKLHRYAEHDRDRFLQIYRGGNGSMVVFGLAVAALVAAVSPLVIPVLFGVEYGPARWLLMILALCIPFRFLATSVGGTLVTQQHMRKKVWYMGGAAALNVGLNFLLIPPYSYYGAAVATVITEIALVTFYLLAARRHVFGRAAWQGWYIIRPSDLRDL